jgi:hypothetical protein
MRTRRSTTQGTGGGGAAWFFSVPPGVHRLTWTHDTLACASLSGSADVAVAAGSVTCVELHCH